MKKQKTEESHDDFLERLFASEANDIVEDLSLK